MINSSLWVPGIPEAVCRPVVLHSLVIGRHIEWGAGIAGELVNKVSCSVVEEWFKMRRELCTLHVYSARGGREGGREGGRGRMREGNE